MKYQVTHTTIYDYTQPVSLCQNIAVLKPRETPLQKCLAARLDIDPLPDNLFEYEDFFANQVVYFAIEHEHQRLSVTSTLLLENNYSGVPATPMFNTQPWSESLTDNALNDIAVRQYAFATPITSASPEIRDYALRSFPQGRTLFDGVKDLMHRIFRDFTFRSGHTTIATPPAEVMHLRVGVCQDFAHIALACLRSLRIPARYVSGYIETIAPKGKEKLVGADASHAWFSVFIPGMGWMDFDPTNDQIPSGQHITVAWGRDYFDVVPLKGVILGSGDNELEVLVDVRRVK